MGGDSIRVTCEADKEIFPEITSITVTGKIVTLELSQQTETHSMSMWQTGNSKAWGDKQINLFVALQRSSFGNYHAGTLTLLKANPVQDIPLWCYPVY